MNERSERPARGADPAPEPAVVWRDALPEDAETVSALEHRVHTLAHERIEVFREKIGLFGAGCRILTKGERAVGYGLAHPWRFDDVPALDSLLGAIPPDPSCLFLHDVAILPEARGSGASRAFVDHAARAAVREGLSCLTLVSIEGTDGLWRRHGFLPSPSVSTAAQLAPYGDKALYMVRRLT